MSSADIEAYLEDLRSAMHDAARDESEARATGDRSSELRARMRYHQLRKAYDEEVSLSPNKMLGDFVKQEKERRDARVARKERRSLRKSQQD